MTHLRYRVLVMAGAMLAASPAFAALTIDSAALNGASSVTVSPGGSLSATVNETNTGGSNWRSTAWRISASAPGTTTCVDHVDHNSVGTAAETFTVTAPTVPGTYNSYFIASVNGSCGGASSATFMLPNSVTVPQLAVVSINRANPNPSSAPTVQWTVVFNESVTGVTAGDFTPVSSGVSGAFVQSLSGSGTTWTVTVNTGICSSGCTLGLNLVDDDSITDSSGNRLGGTGVGNGNFSGQVYNIASTPPLSLWRMEEASWIGAANEVAEYTGAYPGSAFNNATTASGNAGSCRYGVFDNGGSISNGGVLVAGFPNLATDFTITGWIRTTDRTVSGQRIFIDDQNNSGGYGLSLGDGGAGMLRFYARGSSQIILDSTAAINNNTWYFVAGVADIANGIRRVYIFDATGTLLTTNSISSTGWGTDAGNASIGSETTTSAESAFHFRSNLDEVGIYNKVLDQSALTALAQGRACASGLHHLQIESSGSGLTCAPSTLTVRACADAGCTTAYTGGVNGTLSSSGSPTVNWFGTAAFAIASGTNTIAKDVQVTTPGSVQFGVSTASPASANATTCNFGSPTCTFSSASSGFLVSIPNHASCTTQAMTVRAVKQSDTTVACVPAFANTSKNTTVSFSYSTPASGTLVPVVAGSNISASGTSVAMAFDSTGTATPSFVYSDVGRLGILVSYSGSGGTEGSLSLTGSATPIVAPASFGINGITASPATAGADFGATVTAMNACATPTATPNFGIESPAETVVLTFTRTLPTAASASNGTFGGTVGPFTNGAATSANLNWTEVGQGTVAATLASGSYLGSGLTASGVSNSLRFKPAYFDTAMAIPSWSCSALMYSGQPFTATVTARNSSGGTTVNYSGASGFGTANAATLSDANGGTGTWLNNILAATDFTAGVGTKNNVSYTFASRQTAPTVIAIRTTESSGSDNVTSSGHTEATQTITSGRFRMANAFGSELLPLSMMAQTEFYNGTGWVINTNDNCTTLVAAPTSPQPLNTGGSTTPSCAGVTGCSPLTPVSSGDLRLQLSAPNTPGFADITLNVPTWLEFPWVSATPGPPTGRATFGIYKSNQRLIYRRERY